MICAGYTYGTPPSVIPLACIGVALPSVGELFATGLLTLDVIGVSKADFRLDAPLVVGGRGVFGTRPSSLCELSARQTGLCR